MWSASWALQQFGGRIILQSAPRLRFDILCADCSVDVVTPTDAVNCGFVGIYWFHYETFKKAILARHQTTELPIVWAFASGAAAGSIAGIATLPFDVVKTHRQIELGEQLSLKPHVKKDSKDTLTLLINLYRKRGLRALFSGVAPRIAKVAPSCAIMISSYEFFKSYFLKKNLGMANDMPSIHHTGMMLKKPSRDDSEATRWLREEKPKKE